MNDVEYAVYYNVFDEDRVLFVTRADRLNRSDHAVFTGSQKQCRKYALDNQNRGKAKSLRRMPPYER